MSEKFDNAKVGDKVIYHMGGWGNYRELTTITKVGRFINVQRCGRDNFRLSGSSVGYRNGSISLFSEVEWAAYKAEKLDEKKRGDVTHFGWRDCDIELIRKVYDLLPVPEVAE